MGTFFLLGINRRSYHDLWCFTFLLFRLLSKFNLRSFDFLFFDGFLFFLFLNFDLFLSFYIHLLLQKNLLWLILASHIIIFLANFY